MIHLIHFAYLLDTARWSLISCHVAGAGAAKRERHEMVSCTGCANCKSPSHSQTGLILQLVTLSIFIPDHGNDALYRHFGFLSGFTQQCSVTVWVLRSIKGPPGRMWSPSFTDFQDLATAKATLACTSNTYLSPLAMISNIVSLPVLRWRSCPSTMTIFAVSLPLYQPSMQQGAQTCMQYSHVIANRFSNLRCLFSGSVAIEPRRRVANSVLLVARAVTIARPNNYLPFFTWNTSGRFVFSKQQFLYFHGKVPRLLAGSGMYCAHKGFSIPYPCNCIYQS